MFGPIHPGVALALRRLGMDELGIAKAMAAGELPSPQEYENIHLFNMRITGTGTSYRRKHNEFVYRKPEHYLTDEFLQRCSGLPVILMHPDSQMLNSQEFSDRIVGTMLWPYLRPEIEEVWGIAKIYDAAACELMKTMQLSTSPAVVFRDPSVNTKMQLEDGSVLLIEGKPSLLDHLAICEKGVWDKGEAPSGVETELVRGDADMAEAEEKKDVNETEVEAKKAGGGGGAGQGLDDKLSHQLDSVAKMCDSISKRMDNIEEHFKKHKSDDDDDSGRKRRRHDDDDVIGKGGRGRRHDDDDDDDHHRRDEGEDPDKDKAEKVVADKGKKKRHDDDDDDDDSKKRHDEEMEHGKEMLVADKGKKRRHDDDDDENCKKDDSGQISKMLADIDQLKAKLAPVSDDDHRQLADAQARADDVFNALGQRAPRPLEGETVKQYRMRIAGKLKEHSDTWKAVDLGISVFSDDAVFNPIESQIYAEALKAATSPATIKPGTLRMVTKHHGGHEIHEFVGEPRAWMDDIAGPTRQYVTKIHTGNQGGAR